MSGGKPLASQGDSVYIYDGSFLGLMCCVHASVYSGEIPVDIWAEESAPMTLLPVRRIQTDEERADRVVSSIPKKISPQALSLIQAVFLSCCEQKEILILRFLLRAYREGGRLLYSFGDADVSPLIKAERHLMGEAHLLKGFVRFSDYDGALVSVITPKNFVLPYIARHFILRYDNEDFMIFDKTHKAALIYQNKKHDIISLESVDFPAVSAEEERYRALWKRFYNTVSIEARENPRCRMSHMPKRYWENMLEVQELL